MWFIGVEVEQETGAPPPKNNPGSAPAKCVRAASNLITRIPSHSIQMSANFSGVEF